MANSTSSPNSGNGRRGPSGRDLSIPVLLAVVGVVGGVGAWFADRAWTLATSIAERNSARISVIEAEIKDLDDRRVELHREIDKAENRLDLLASRLGALESELKGVTGSWPPPAPSLGPQAPGPR